MIKFDVLHDVTFLRMDDLPANVAVLLVELIFDSH